MEEEGGKVQTFPHTGRHWLSEEKYQVKFTVLNSQCFSLDTFHTESLSLICEARKVTLDLICLMWNSLGVQKTIIIN